MNKSLQRVGIVLIVILVALQLVPVDSTNPPPRAEPGAPAPVQELLKRSCYDCHSNETVWPWYSRIAPVSWLIARDVKKGRREVNFSVWDNYEEKRKARKLREIAKEVEKGDMPPRYYTPLHPQARLSATERELIVKWAKRG
jgi:hypothetical protein